MATDAANNDESMARLAAVITTAMERINSRSSASNDDANATTSSGPSAWSQPSTHPATDSDSHARAVESPTDNFVTPPTDQSPEDSLDLSHRPPLAGSQKGGASVKSSGSIISIAKTRQRRSSSGAGAVLARLTSRSSVTTSGGGVSTDSQPPISPSGRPKLDMAALTRQRSKYKSGVNWDNPDIMGKYEEPFEVSTSPIDERNTAESPLYQDAQQEALRELASAGGTKAALAQANATTIGVPFFPTSHRAVMDMQQDAAAAAFLGKQRSPPAATSLSPALARETSPRSLNSSSSNNDDAAQQQKITPEEAQRRLQSARDAVAMANAAVKVPAASAEQPAVSPPPADTEEEKKSGPNTEAKRKARRSFIQMVSGSKDKEGKKKSGKSGKKSGAAAKNSSSRSASPSGSSATPTRRSSSTAADTPATSYTNGTTSPDSTVGRRRRFNDTRELNLVASQLAAEALMPPSPPSVGLGAHPSMMGVLSPSPATSSDARMTGNVSPPLGSGSVGHSSVTHGQHSSLNGLGGAPQPPFAADNRSIGGPSSIGGGSPRNGSPRLDGMYEPPRAAFARPSPGGSPTLTQSAKLSGLPSDMLTGLNDGPYPFLPPRALDLTDPFAAPANAMEFEVGGRPGGLGGRNSLPNTGGVSSSNMNRNRGMSSGSTQTWGGSNGGTVTPGRRSVLQMTMHNPEQELQGLTKPPKSGRSTPFGSRAPSRQVTPNASVTNLRELAKEEAEKANVALKEAAKAAKAKSRADRASESAASKGNNGAGASISKGPRLSMFRKNKSATDLNGSNTALANSNDLTMTAAKAPSAASTQQLKPPARQTTGGGGSVTESTNTGGSSQFRLSASNDSMTSRPMSIPTTDDQDGAGSARVNASAQSLVKVPSPSMTSTSGSSHDRSGGIASSEGGASNIFSASNVTTPDMQAAAVAKPDSALPKPPMPMQAGPTGTSQPAAKPMPPLPAGVPSRPPMASPPNVTQQPVTQGLPPPQAGLPVHPQMLPPRPYPMQRPMAPGMAPPQAGVPFYPQMSPPNMMMQQPRPSGFPPPQTSLPAHAHMSQTHDASLQKTSPAMTPPVRPGMPAVRSASANRVGSSADTVMAKGRAGGATPASSTHSAATSRPKFGKFMSRFSSRGSATTQSSPAGTPPPLPTSGGGKAGGVKAFASRSQGHLPASAPAAANQHKPNAGTPPPTLPVEAKPRVNTKFNSFRSNFQRDWFV